MIPKDAILMQLQAEANSGAEIYETSRQYSKLHANLQ
jgi:hypothetical protein